MYYHFSTRIALLRLFLLVLSVSCPATSSRFAWSAERHASAAEFVIVESAQPRATIVVARDADEGELFAASELQSYIAKASGAEIPIRKDDEDVSGNVIAVGQNRFNDDAKLGYKKLAKNGFRIKTDGKLLSLAGSDAEGTQYAVYSFLEDYLGIRWLWPGELGEVVPKTASIAVGRIDRSEEPDFIWRDRGPGGAMWGATTGPTEMHARARLLGITPEHQRQVRLWEKRNKWGGMKVYGGHVLGEIFTPEKYAATHPEYYSLVNGRRAVPGKNYDYKHGGQVCTTNPEVIEVTADWVRDFFDKHPDYGAVHVSMNDGLGFCQCKRCRALDSDNILKEKGIEAEEAESGSERTNSITDRIFTFANAVAQEVQQTHPGKYVMNFAYSRYILPPEKVRIQPHVIPQYCLWGAYRHACPATKLKQLRQTARWADVSRYTGIYEYYINGSWPGLHRLVTRHIAESIKDLHAQGYDFYQTQAGDEFATNGINYYVAGRLLWDSSLDEETIRDDFYRAGFGPAAGAVRRFHDRLIDAWDKATADGEDFSCVGLKNSRNLPKLFSRELLDDCRGDLDAAEKPADSDAVRKRIEFFRKGLHYTELTIRAVRATMDVEKSGLDVGNFKQATRDIHEVDRKKALPLVKKALAAWQARDAFVEEQKNDYSLAYFWIKYNDRTRGFNQTERLLSLVRELNGELK